MTDADEIQLIKDALSRFQQVDAYRFNSASIRVRVVDEAFAGLAARDRYPLVEPLLDTLPEATQIDIITLLMLARGELAMDLSNRDFEEEMPKNLRREAAKRPDALLMGGACSGLEVALGGKSPQSIRTFHCGSHIGLLYPVHYQSPLFGDEAKEWRYAEFEKDCYCRTEYVTTTGLAVYAWLDADGWLDDGKLLRKDGLTISKAAVAKAEY